LNWLKQIFSRRRIYNDLSDEIQAHLDEKIEELVAAGMPRKEATAAARREFGNLTLVEEDSRTVWRWPSVENFFLDARYGTRLLRKNPGFTAAAVLTLALGIASTSVLLSILDGAYIHFGETAQANRVIALTQQFTQRESTTWRFSPAEYLDIAGLDRFFDGFFAIAHSGSSLTENSERGENPEQVPVVLATANIFSLYGISPLLGRVFTPDEDHPGGPNVAVVSYRLWNRRFASDPALVGKTIKLDGVPYTVIGIAPRRFQHWGADIYLPLALDPASTNRAERTLTVAGVLRDGLSAEQTAPALRQLAKRVEAQYGAANPEYRGLVYVPVDVRNAVVGDLRIALYVLMGAVAMLLLIAAANIANLLLARAQARAREIATRMAMGATPGRLARQFFTEGLLLSGVAGVLGALLGIWALPPILALIPQHFIGEESEIHPTPEVFLASLGVALVLGIGFGLVSALFVARRGVAGNLGSQGRSASTADHHGGRLRTLLVLSEMALAFLVVTGAGLMVRSYRHMTSMDLGFQPDQVLTLRVALPELRYRGNTVVLNFFTELLRRVRPLPGIVDAATSSIRPMDGESVRNFSIPGRLLNTADGTASADYRVVSPDYFAVLRTPLREGRSLTEQDGPDAPAVAIVNERFARAYFPNETILGKQLRLERHYDSRSAPAEPLRIQLLQVVGVVADSRQLASRHVHDLFDPASPEIFVPFLQHPEDSRDMALLLRTSTKPETLTDAVRAQVLALDPDRPVYSIQTLREISDVALGPARLSLLLLAIFAVTSLLTACIGLFAIVSYTVTQRTNEIGIRMALGAQRWDVLRIVATEGIFVVAAGLAIGLMASFGITRLMSSLLFRVASNDTLTLLLVSVILTAVALLASYLPARRATRVDPMIALRYE